MNIKARKDLQQELLGIVFNILIESEDSAIEAMETRAVEIIKKIKEHINDYIEHGTGFDSQKMPILDWIVACDSQDHVRLNNKSLLKFEKAIKDVGGRSQGRAPQPINENEIESIVRLLLEQEQLNHVRIRGEREVPLNLFEENIIIREQIRPRGQMRSRYIRREREVPLSSKIGELIGVVSSIIVGAFIGIMVGMVIAGLCIELCVITTAEPILLIMGATAVIGAIVAGTAPVLKLIEMFKGQEPNLSPSSGLESSNTEHTYLNRQRVI